MAEKKTSKGKRSVLVLNSDSFRWDNLTVHGGKDILTPNIDALAAKSVIFENAYAGSYPTLPNRTDVFLGTWTFPNLDWGPLDRKALTLAEAVASGGAATYLEIDCPHMVNKGNYFERGFQSYNFVRGHEGDALAPLPLVEKMPIPGDPLKYRQPTKPVQQHQANMVYRNRKNDEDYLMAVVARQAVKDLEYMGDRQFFMWVDMFDPHEPHDAPRHYFDLYYPEYDGVIYIIPIYGECDRYTKDELRAIKAAYLAEVTMVDAWIGFILGQLKGLGLEDNTIIVFTSDHGLAYGDHGQTGKNFSPLFANIARIPLLISTPEMRAAGRGTGSAGKGRKVSQLAQPVDLMPTILEAMGIAAPAGLAPEGVSLMPIVEGKSLKTRDAAFTGAYIKGPNSNTPGGHLRVSTKQWSLIFPPIRDGKRAKPMLFDLTKDPAELNNVIAKNMKVAMDLYKEYLKFFKKANRTGEAPHVPSPDSF